MARCTDHIHLCSLSLPRSMNAGVPQGSHSSAQRGHASGGISRGWPPHPSRAHRNRTPCRSFLLAGRTFTSTLALPVVCSVSPNANPTPFSMSCSTRSPRMLTSECASTGNRIQLRSEITGSVLFLLNEEHRVLPDIRLSHPPFDIWRQTRHALRATPHGERPESVEYEWRTVKVAKERQMNRDSSIEEGFVSGTRIQ
jgi:hypothetical protein